MVVFGGRNGTEVFNDVAVFDMVNMTWLDIMTTGTSPSPRAYHTAVVGILYKPKSFCSSGSYTYFLFYSILFIPFDPPRPLPTRDVCVWRHNYWQ